MKILNIIRNFSLIEWLVIACILFVATLLGASGAWAMVLPVALPIALFCWNKKVLLTYLSIYILVYCILSAKGSYDGVIPGGGIRWFPYGFKNTYREKPGARIKTEHPTTLGWLFWPLWSIDTWLVHNR